MTTPGINVVGYFHAENGVGEAARLLVAAADAARVTHSEVALFGPHRDLRPFVCNDAFSTPRSKNILAVNADSTGPITQWLSTTPLADLPTAALWAWEVDEFPEWMADNAAYLDAVWTHSEFSRSAIARKVDIPVYAFNPAIPLRSGTQRDRRGLGLPDGFVFLYCFDYLSVFERKNPLGLVSAFTRAFAPNEGPTLILKGVNADAAAHERELLLAATEGRTDVRVWNDYMDFQTQQALVSSCDAYVSLHRAEGFGLTLAEAMALGKPVIGTAFSGNLDYMTEENSFLVPCEVTKVPEGTAPYPPGATWAEPDLDAAADLLRRVASDPGEVSRRVANARRDLAREHSLEVSGARMAELLRSLDRRERPAGPPSQHTGLKRRLRERAGDIVRRLGRVDVLDLRLADMQRRQELLHSVVMTRIDKTEYDLRWLVGRGDASTEQFPNEALRLVTDDGREQLGFEENRGEGVALRANTFVLEDHTPIVHIGSGDVDPLATLRKLPPGSVGSVACKDVAEYLAPMALANLVNAASTALRSGGFLVIETANPHSIDAMKNLWLNPTHVKPVPPELLLLLCRSAGFSRGVVSYRHGTGDLGRDRRTCSEYSVIAHLGERPR